MRSTLTTSDGFAGALGEGWFAGQRQTVVGWLVPALAVIVGILPARYSATREMVLQAGLPELINGTDRA